MRHAAMLLFSFCFWYTLIRIFFFNIMKINNFWGELTVILAEKEALARHAGPWYGHHKACRSCSQYGASYSVSSAHHNDNTGTCGPNLQGIGRISRAFFKAEVSVGSPRFFFF